MHAALSNRKHPDLATAFEGKAAKAKGPPGQQKMPELNDYIKVPATLMTYIKVSIKV